VRIALDASCIARPQPTGVAAYARNLILHLAALDTENGYYVGYRLSRLKYGKRFLGLSQPNFKIRLFHDLPGLRLPKGLDLFHGLDARISFWKGPQKLATFHDIGLILHPEFGTAHHREKILGRYERVSREADWILADSHHTSRDIQRYFQVPERKIRVIHLGVEERFFPRDPGACFETLRPYGLSDPYVLFLGGLSYRKNVSRMLEAFFSVCKRTSERLQFVIGGEEGHGAGEILARINRSSLRDRVRWIGYVPPEVLPCLYSRALALAFVTLYEGFGLPVLEAMACGVPVVASTSGSLPEVVGDAALLVDPHDTRQIEEALLRVVEDPACRKDLREKGFERAKQFTWQRTAQETLAYYADICGKPPRLQHASFASGCGRP